MPHVCTAYSAVASTYAYDPQNQTAEDQTAANRAAATPANTGNKETKIKRGGKKKEKNTASVNLGLKGKGRWVVSDVVC